MPRFSVKTMLGAVAVLATALALTLSIPLTVAQPILLFATFTLPGILTTGAVYGDRFLRSFCIGAFFPNVAVLIHVSTNLTSLFDWGSFGGIRLDNVVGHYASIAVAVEDWRRIMGCGIVASMAAGFFSAVFCGLLTRERH